MIKKVHRGKDMSALDGIRVLDLGTFIAGAHCATILGEFGACVDLALYESVFHVFDEIAPAHQKCGYVRERMGADTVNVCPHNHCATEDGKWIAIACTSDQMFARLAAAMEQPELASAERCGPKDLRLAASDDVNKMVSVWGGSLDLDTVLALCSRGGVPASLIVGIADIFEDPQYRAQGNIQMTASRAGEITVPGVVPRLSETPGEIRRLGAGLGAQNEDVYKGLLELSSAEIEDLRISGVI